MARSYARLKRRSSAGVLVRENPVQRAVSSNSLYCVPVKAYTSGAVSSDFVALKKKQAHTLEFGVPSGTAPTLGGVVRVSSILITSRSPYIVKVLNASGGYTTYNCPGQKVTRITFSRENSVAGNSALFNNNADPLWAPDLVKISAAEDPVDMRFNCVVDGTLDE